MSGVCFLLQWGKQKCPAAEYAGCPYSRTSLIRTPVIRAPPSTGQLILSILAIHTVMYLNVCLCDPFNSLQDDFHIEVVAMGE